AADGGRADRALSRRRSEIARADLPRARAEPLELARGEPDDDLAVENADRGRDRAALADGGLRREPDRDALPGREAVRHERRLERDDVLRRAPLVRDADHGIAPSFAQHRAAASRPSSGPPTRKPAASASPAPVASTTSVGTAGNG